MEQHAAAVEAAVAAAAAAVEAAAPTLAAETRAHRGELACLALAGCGARLASGGGDGALALWERRRGAGAGGGGGWAEAARRPHAHRYGVTAAAWGRAGALLLSGGGDGALRLWARAGAGGGQLAERRTLAAVGAAGVRAVAWAGAARVAAAHEDGAARVWAVRGALLARVEGAEGGALPALAVLARAPLPPLLLTASAEGTLRLYDLTELCSSDDETAAAVPIAVAEDAHDLGALCAVAAPDGRHLATGGRDGRVLVWDRELTAVGVLAGHAAAVTALAWGARGLLASASQDRTARLWAGPPPPPPRLAVCLHVLPAHSRYLTCLALAPDLRYLLTGSNDRTFRTWALGASSLDEEPAPCDASAHFAVGDLEGIHPPPEELPESGGRGRGAEGGARCVWSERAHAGAVNCIAAHGDHLATASSDGTVRVWRWAGAALAAAHTLGAHRYPALACAFGAGGGVLATGALDGRASLWDVRSGVHVRELAVPGAGGAGGATGGVRDVRLTARGAPRVLIATDDGLTAVWRAADPDPRPQSVHGGLASAALCCAWSPCARVCAVGGAGGELRLLAPPHPHPLHHDPDAHDLGVTCCDFSPAAAERALGLPPARPLLATAGNDSLLKLWLVELSLPEEQGGVPSARAALACSLRAHGGAVADVRWAGGGRGEGEGEGRGEGQGQAEGALLATAGDDRWARVWRVCGGAAGALRLLPHAAVRAEGAGGALAALPVRGLLAVGTLAGHLALWRLSPPAPPAPGEDDDDATPRLWREAAVERWLREHVARQPAVGRGVSAGALLARARSARLTGARLLDEDAERLLECLGLGAAEAGAAGQEGAAGRARLSAELAWLRAGPAEGGRGTPHALLCPLSHTLLRWPASAADGFTYERDHIREWLLAAPPEGAVSPMTGRRLRSTRLTPNYKLLEAVRAHLRRRAAAGSGDEAGDGAEAGDGPGDD